MSSAHHRRTHERAIEYLLLDYDENALAKMLRISRARLDMWKAGPILVGPMTEQRLFVLHEIWSMLRWFLNYDNAIARMDDPVQTDGDMAFPTLQELLDDSRFDAALATTYAWYERIDTEREYS